MDDNTDEKAHPNHMRKTTKWAIAGSCVLLSIGPLKDLKEFLFADQIVTNARLERTMIEGFKDLNAKLDAHIVAENSTHIRIRDLGREELAAAEARCEKRVDETKDRVSNLEVFAFKLNTQKKFN